MRPRIANRVAVAVRNRAEKISRCGIERIDYAVARLADEYRVTQWAKIRSSLRDAPGRIQGTGSNEPADKISLQIKNADDPVAGAGQRVSLVRILHCERDKQLVADHLHAERSEASRKIRIAQRALRRKCGVKQLHRSIVKVG